MSLRRWLAANWFLAGLAVAVLLAWLAPGVGSKEGPLNPSVAVKGAIAVIFLLQGLLLDGAALRQGAGRWKLHILVQAFTFLLFPLAGLALDAVAGESLPSGLRLGFLYLLVLPSTVSTAVVFTTQAGGSTPAAVFNATLSSLLGVFATPLWTGWLLDVSGAEAGAAYRPGAVLMQLILLVLLPLAVGMALRPAVRRWVDPRRKLLGNLNSLLVLVMVYTAFCDSFEGGIWTRTPPPLLLGTLVGVVLLFASATLTAWWAAGRLGLERVEQITALFCAPQKTLASGVPMAKLLFPGNPELGLILLPLLLYHPLQLLVGGVIAARLGRAR